MTTKDRNELLEAAEGYAYLRGRGDGQNARADGMPEPNLSGECAGDLTPNVLAAQVWSIDELDGEEVSSICDFYEKGVADGYYAD